jgi:hypothetical protein
MDTHDLADPYRLLRYREPGETPEDEVCRCADRPPLMLLAALDPNPVRCLMCNGEVLPERLELTSSLAAAIANWSGLSLAMKRSG